MPKAFPPIVRPAIRAAIITEETFSITEEPEPIFTAKAAPAEPLIIPAISPTTSLHMLMRKGAV